MRVAIIGAGMAGLACAEALRLAGVAAVIFDKGRAVGGRMSTRRVATDVGEASFDHGAQYFTVRDAAFRARVQRWHAMGLAAPWPAASTDAWVGTPGMNAPAKQMAAGLDVRQAMQVDALVRDGDGWQVGGDTFDAVLVATPRNRPLPCFSHGTRALRIWRRRPGRSRVGPSWPPSPSGCRSRAM